MTDNPIAAALRAADEIAASLTLAEREALRWLPVGAWRNPLDADFPEHVDRELDNLDAACLVHFGDEAYAVAMTPLGEQVRTILEQEGQRDA